MERKKKDGKESRRRQTLRTVEYHMSLYVSQCGIYKRRL